MTFFQTWEMKSLRKYVRKYMAMNYRDLDKPSLVGIRVALLLWPPNWFETHYIAPIKLTQKSTRRLVTGVKDRVHVSMGERKVFAGIFILYFRAQCANYATWRTANYFFTIIYRIEKCVCTLVAVSLNVKLIHLIQWTYGKSMSTSAEKVLINVDSRAEKNGRASAIHFRSSLNQF